MQVSLGMLTYLLRCLFARCCEVYGPLSLAGLCSVVVAYASVIASSSVVGCYGVGKLFEAISLLNSPSA